MTGPGGADRPEPQFVRAGALEGVLDRASATLAVVGGVILIAVSFVVAAGVIGRWMFAREITGAFEIVQVGVAVAAFLSLPVCQFRNGNIVVDALTARAPARLRTRLDGFWALCYAAVALVLAWGLATGARETIGGGMVTSMLQLPFGWAMVVGAAALAFLAAVSLFVAYRHLQAGGR